MVTQDIQSHAVMVMRATPRPEPRFKASTARGREPTTLDVVEPSIVYGAELPTDQEFRLCGDPRNKRVIELGSPHATVVAFARLGAKAIVVDASATRISEIRSLAERHEVSVECHLGSPADLGFATSASVDLVFCTSTLDGNHDISRVFRQVHRVLRPEASFVVAMTHPISKIVSDGKVIGRYGDASGPSTSVAGIFAALQRANFAVDVLLEPMTGGSVPSHLIARARKLGI